MKNSRIKNGIMRIVQGIIIGAGAILPGISGGVLSVIFGIYRPVMEVLAHPLNGLRRHLSLLLPVGAGAILGFLCGGGLILVLFDRSEKLATCLFIGPSLWAEAGAQGRGRGAYLSCAASFLALSAVLLYAQYGAFYTMRPGFLGFLFCGLLWGLSLIVPGMTSSSILMAVGLFTPMAEGFARLDMAVILPWLLGMALIVLTLARVVNWCFQTHYPLFYHAVFGIVLASTVVIIPLHYDGARDVLLCLLAAALGALARTRNVIEDPLDLRAGKIGVDEQAGLLLHIRAKTVGRELIADGRRAAALPDDCVIDGLAGVLVPDDRRLALVRDADAGDVRRRQAALFKRLAHGKHLTLKDDHRVMFHPARFWVDLREGILRQRHNVALTVENNRAGTGCTLVKCNDVAVHN